MANSVEVKGLNKLVRDLKQLDPDVVKDLRAQHLKAAEMVAATARGIAPHRTGRLQRDIRAGATQRSGVIRAGRKRVPYAGPIHFGWPNRPNRARGWRGGPFGPQPFLYDALDHRRGEVLDAWMDALEDAVRKVN